MNLTTETHIFDTENKQKLNMNRQIYIFRYKMNVIMRMKTLCIIGLRRTETLNGWLKFKGYVSRFIAHSIGVKTTKTFCKHVLTWICLSLYIHVLINKEPQVTREWGKIFSVLHLHMNRYSSGQVECH